jgi:hypothetical protein
MHNPSLSALGSSQRCMTTKKACACVLQAFIGFEGLRTIPMMTTLENVCQCSVSYQLLDQKQSPQSKKHLTDTKSMYLQGQQSGAVAQSFDKYLLQRVSIASTASTSGHSATCPARPQAWLPQKITHKAPALATASCSLTTFDCHRRVDLFSNWPVNDQA